MEEHPEEAVKTLLLWLPKSHEVRRTWVLSTPRIT
jgi:hypothetical protein